MPGLKMLPGNTLDLGHKIPTAKRESWTARFWWKIKQSGSKQLEIQHFIFGCLAFETLRLEICVKMSDTKTVLDFQQYVNGGILEALIWPQSYLVRQVTYGSTFELCHGYNPNGKSKLWKGLTNNFSWISLEATKQAKMNNVGFRRSDGFQLTQVDVCFIKRA